MIPCCPNLQHTNHTMLHHKLDVGSMMQDTHHLQHTNHTMLHRKLDVGSRTNDGHDRSEQGSLARPVMQS